MRRNLAVGAVVALALAVATWTWIAHRLDGFVVRTVEQVGSELLGSRVSVERARVELRRGRARLSGIAIANPDGPELGFSSQPALSLGEVTVALDLDALDLAAVRAGEAPLPLTLVRVENPRVRAEATSGGLNLERLRQNAREAAPSGQTEPQSTAGAPIRIRIARLEFAGGEVSADATRVGGKVEQVALPEFALEGIGGANGATSTEIGKRVCDALLSRAIRAAVLGGAGSELGRAREKAREKLRGLFE